MGGAERTQSARVPSSGVSFRGSLCAGEVQGGDLKRSIIVMCGENYWRTSIDISLTMQNQVEELETDLESTYKFGAQDRSEYANEYIWGWALRSLALKDETTLFMRRLL